jgi:putative peptidoglycan lipid II flippase
MTPGFSGAEVPDFVWNMEKFGRILKTTYVVAGATLCASVLGLFRDRLLASSFGAGHDLDTYYAAFRVPDFVLNVLILGALFAAFIPVFTDLWVSKNKKTAWKTANTVLNLFAIAAILVSALIFVFAEPLMKILTPGFDLTKIRQTVLLTRILLITPFFFGIASIFGSILNSFKRFLAFALTPVYYNACIILGIVFLAPKIGILGPVIGAVLGAVVQAFSLLIPVMRVGFRWQAVLEIGSELKQIGKLMIPRTASLAISQLNLLLEMAFASTLAGGSIAVLRLSSNLQNVPASILGIAFATAIFPTLAERISRKEIDSYKINLSFAFRQIMFFVIPITAAIVILRAQIVRLVLGAGAFGWTDTALTASCLGFFAISLFAQTLQPLLLRGFFAIKDTKTPFWISALALGCYILSAVILTKYFDVLGLALAFSVTAVIQTSMLMTGLRVKIGSIGEFSFMKQAAKFILASFVMGVGMYLSLQIMALVVNTQTVVGLFVQTLVAVLVGLGLYLLSTKIFRCEELKYLKESFKKIVLKENPACRQAENDV